jgi:catechol 2,3-dioxygenase-like lactoylglutathione lyase family enzyme
METNVFANHDAITNLAVKDLNTARKFYEQTLGLSPIDQMEETVTYRSGSSSIQIYKSQFAGTNKATAVSWRVDDMDQVVKQLKGKGVKFEHYQLPGLELKGDVHIGEGMKIAWFKDPDGNILAVYSGHGG